MISQRATRVTRPDLGGSLEGTARQGGEFAAPRRLASRERMALVVKRREYPTRWVLDGLIQNRLLLVERESAGSVELARELQPRLIIAVADPTRAFDLHLISELALNTSAFLLLLAPGPAGYAEALLAGADACLCDADGPSAFSAQVAAVMRKEAASDLDNALEEGVVRAGGLTVELRAHRVTYRERPLRVSPSEFAILSYLLVHTGAMCRSTEITFAMTGELLSETAASERLKPHIAHLRRKLRAIDPNVDPITNVRGVGYRIEST